VDRGGFDKIYDHGPWIEELRNQKWPVVEARPRQVGDKTATDRIGESYEHYRHAAGCSKSGASASNSARATTGHAAAPPSPAIDPVAASVVRPAASSAADTGPGCRERVAAGSWSKDPERLHRGVVVVFGAVCSTPRWPQAEAGGSTLPAPGSDVALINGPLTHPAAAMVKR
jgi:hypothetical protein